MVSICVCVCVCHAVVVVIAVVAVFVVIAYVLVVVVVGDGIIIIVVVSFVAFLVLLLAVVVVLLLVLLPSCWCSCCCCCRCWLVSVCLKFVTFILIHYRKKMFFLLGAAERPRKKGVRSTINYSLPGWASCTAWQPKPADVLDVKYCLDMIARELNGRRLVERVAGRYVHSPGAPCSHLEEIRKTSSDDDNKEGGKRTCSPVRPFL